MILLLLVFLDDIVELFECFLVAGLMRVELIGFLVVVQRLDRILHEQINGAYVVFVEGFVRILLLELLVQVHG